MELTPSSGKAFTNAGQTMGYRISNENAGFIMDILATKLYTDPLMAPPREIITNAFDAHLMSGKQDVPVRITPPHGKDLNFRVRDFGPGLSPEQMKSFFSFGDSDKRHSNEATGGFGIGSKSPFAIADSFTTSIVYNGMQYIWQSFKKDGSPHSACLLTAPTQEPTGVEVIIPIAEKDLLIFNTKLADFLSYCKSRYELAAPLSVSSPVPILHAEDNTPVLYGKKAELHVRSGTMVRMGDICYKLPVSMKANGDYGAVAYGAVVSPEEKSWLHTSNAERNTFIYDMPIGSLAISPNREEIIDSEKNRKAVREYTARVIDAALKYRWKEFIKSVTADTHSFLYFFFQSLDNWTDITPKIVDYVIKQRAKEFPHLKLDDYLLSPTGTILFDELRHAQSFVKRIMEKESFIEDVGLLYMKSSGGSRSFFKPTSKDIFIDSFLSYGQLTHKNTTLTPLDEVGRRALHEEYFGKTPPKNMTFRSYPFAPGRYCPDGNYKSLSGRYFVTKPLSEIKDPFYRWIVASLFITPPGKGSGPTTVSPALKKALVVVPSEDMTSVHMFSRYDHQWKAVEGKPATPSEVAVIVRYSTGPSYVFSQDPYLKRLIEYKRQKPLTVESVRKTLLTALARSGGAWDLFALKEGVALPPEYAKHVYEIGDWMHYNLVASEASSLRPTTLLPKELSNTLPYYYLGDILPPRDHEYCLKRIPIFADVCSPNYKTFGFPPSRFPFETVQILNSSEYEYRTVPVDSDNTKLIHHLSRFYEPFFNFQHVSKDNLNGISANLSFIFLQNISLGATLADACYSEFLLNYSHTLHAIFQRVFPYFVYSYYDMDLSKPPELSSDLLKRYSADVIRPFMAAVQYRLEKR